jgi:hypothetical protein
MVLTLVTLSTTLSTRVAAQEDEDDRKRGFELPYFAPKLMLTAAGEGETDFGTIAGVGTPTLSDDLEAGYGVGLAYMHPLLGLLALGGQISVLSWTSESAADADLDRNLLLDFSFVPQVNLDIAIVEVYASLPIGFTLDFVGDDRSFSAGAASASVGTGTGYHIGLMLGARVALSRTFGLLGEIGYVAHSFSHEVEAMVLGVTASNDVDFSMGQGALNLGVYF